MEVEVEAAAELAEQLLQGVGSRAGLAHVDAGHLDAAALGGLLRQGVERFGAAGGQAHVAAGGYVAGGEAVAQT